MYNFITVMGVVLQELGVISPNGYIDHQLSQKKIYLLQELGVDLRHLYIWNSKGPYSTGLTGTLESLEKYRMVFLESTQDKELSDYVKKGIEIVNMLEEIKPEKIDKYTWYELITSINYIRENKYLWELESTVGYTEIIKIIHTDITEELYEKANSTVRKFALIKKLIK